MGNTKMRCLEQQSPRQAPGWTSFKAAPVWSFSKAAPAPHTPQGGQSLGSPWVDLLQGTCPLPLPVPPRPQPPLGSTTQCFSLFLCLNLSPGQMRALPLSCSLSSSSVSYLETRSHQVVWVDLKLSSFFSL